MKGQRITCPSQHEPKFAGERYKSRGRGEGREGRRGGEGGEGAGGVYVNKEAETEERKKQVKVKREAVIEEWKKEERDDDDGKETEVMIKLCKTWDMDWLRYGKKRGQSLYKWKGNDEDKLKRNMERKPARKEQRKLQTRRLK